MEILEIFQVVAILLKKSKLPTKMIWFKQLVQ